MAHWVTDEANDWISGLIRIFSDRYLKCPFKNEYKTETEKVPFADCLYLEKSLNYTSHYDLLTSEKSSSASFIVATLPQLNFFIIANLTILNTDSGGYVLKNLLKMDLSDSLGDAAP